MSDREHIRQSRFLFHHPAPTDIYTLSLHDALPISNHQKAVPAEPLFRSQITRRRFLNEWERVCGSAGMPRSEERFSRNAETDLVCRLLLEKKKHRRDRYNPHLRPVYRYGFEPQPAE